MIKQLLQKINKAIEEKNHDNLDSLVNALLTYLKALNNEPKYKYDIIEISNIVNLILQTEG